MGSAQHELVAHPLEGALLGHVAQDHDAPQPAFLVKHHRRQPPAQHALLALGFYHQVLRLLLQGVATQHSLSQFVQLRVAEGLRQRLAAWLFRPGQLALGHGIGVLYPAMAVEDQQAVVDTVEHRLQALLLGQQLLDIARLEHAQGLGHQPEAADQRGDLVHRRQRQGDLEVPLADLVGGLGQGVYGLAEAPGYALGGNDADQQHRNAEQAYQAGDQYGALAGGALGAADHRQRVPLEGHHAVTQVVQGMAELIVVQQA
ncbi:hypothetical protein D9M70_389390 [compost metagenome]